MVKILFAALVCFVTCSLVGCATTGAELEGYREAARVNAYTNAKRYLAEAELDSKYNVVSQADTAQTPLCPQGSGWVTLRATLKDGERPDQHYGPRFDLKCSTSSEALGCFLSKDFVFVRSSQGRCDIHGEKPVVQ